MSAPPLPRLLLLLLLQSQPQLQQWLQKWSEWRSRECGGAATAAAGGAAAVAAAVKTQTFLCSRSRLGAMAAGVAEREFVWAGAAVRE